MMGRLIVLYKIIAAAVLFLVLWYVCASEFKKLVEKDWIPLLERHKSHISYEAIDINEYLFQVKIKNLRGSVALGSISKGQNKDDGVELKKSSNRAGIESINFAADGDVLIQYIPLLGYIRKSLSYEISFDVFDGDTNVKWYQHADNMVGWFRKPVLHKEPLNWDVNITYDGINAGIYVNDTKMEILELKNIREALSNRPMGDDRAAMDFDISYTITSNAISSLYSLAKDKPNQDHADIYFSKLLPALDGIEKLTLPYNDKLKIHAEYAIEPYYAIKKFLDGSGALSKVFASIIDHPWLLDASFSSDSQYFDSKASFLFHNKEFTKLGFDFLSKSKNPKEFAEKMFVIVYLVLSDLYPDFKDTKQELYDVLIPLFSIKNQSIGLSYSNPSKEHYHGSLNLCVNDFVIKLIGQCEALDRCSANNIFLYPKEYASAVLHYTQAAVIALANKLLEKENRSIKVDLMELEEPLFDFLDAVDKNGDADDKLEIDISYDKSASKELSFNGKKIAEIVSDYRVAYLIKKLSEVSEAVEKAYIDKELKSR